MLSHDTAIEASSSADLVGQLFVDRVHFDDRPRVEQELARQMRSSFAVRWLDNDGTYRVVRWVSLPSVNDRKIFAIGHRQPVALTGSERLLSLGQIALGVVHDLKNVLVHPLGLQLQRVERALEAKSPDRARVAIGAMREVLRDGLEAMDRMLHFARPSDRPSMLRLDIEGIVWRATEIARAYARSTTSLHDIEIAYEPGKPKRVECDAFELLAALVNVMFNAVDAVVESGGKVEVRTGKSTDRVFIEVLDNGPGMSAEVRQRIFEPFFTTKPQGIGIGLAMVKACVDRHRGVIGIDSAAGRGTTFRIELPQP